MDKAVRKGQDIEKKLVPVSALPIPLFAYLFIISAQRTGFS